MHLFIQFDVCGTDVKLLLSNYKVVILYLYHILYWIIWRHIRDQPPEKTPLNGFLALNIKDIQYTVKFPWNIPRDIPWDTPWDIPWDIPWKIPWDIPWKIPLLRREGHPPTLT